MKRLMVVLVTCVAVLGCGAASQYKFSCIGDTRCDVETSGPTEVDLRQEFGKTIKVVDVADGRVTIEVGGQRESFAMGDQGTLESVRVEVTNVKGESALFVVRR